MTPAPAPSSTYRLQLGPDLDLDDAAGLVDRLHHLGISHVYLSPILQAAPGSTHGYDTVDHGRISDELGGRAALDRLAVVADDAGMGLVVDVVPNHMSIAAPAANQWWWDVLENGPMSRFARHFDITWDSSEARQLDTVLMPILGDHYGVVLEAGELRLDRTDGGLVLRYHDHTLPLAPRSLETILTPVEIEMTAGGAGPELGFVIDALRWLPTDPAHVDRRHRDLTVLRRMLTEALADPSVGRRVDDRLARLSADPDALHEVLEQQHYQLSHWRRAQRDLDYRRFFDIDTLIGLRIEDPVVFDDTHRLILELVADGTIDGLRIDHPDGLTDPAGYLERLASRTGGAWTVVEKILEAGELLPATWPVAGTTGYDFLRVADGVFRDPIGVQTLTAWWHDHVDPTGWDDTVTVTKAEILDTVLAADVSRLADIGLRLCEGHRRHRDHTRHDVTHAIRAIVAAMPVYRTYVRPGVPATAVDREVVGAAVARATETDPDVDADLFGFLHSVLCGEHDGDLLAGEFVERFQQLTGPAMAKSVEDTAFYRFLPVPAANEVGGHPGEPFVSVAELHEHNGRIQRDWPTTMTALSTHDTKRSADVRSRLDALTTVADRWTSFATRWMAWAEPRWGVDPDPVTTQLLLQTLVGAWPIDADRLTAYLEKATKEAKRRTSWTDPDPAFDDAVVRLARAALDDADLVADVVALVGDITPAGRHIAGAKALLHLTSPGVPDCYQGSELWDLSLVDPDNRRPVDHTWRATLTDELLARGGPDRPLDDDDVGVHKLWVTHRALTLRRRRPDAFGPGPAGVYQAIDAGPDVIAFRRGDDVLVAMTRHPSVGVAVLDLPEGHWNDLLSGRSVTGTVEVAGMVLLEREAA